MITEELNLNFSVKVTFNGKHHISGYSAETHTVIKKVMTIKMNVVLLPITAQVA